MPVYLHSRQLGQAIAKELHQREMTQKQAARELETTQGQISHLLSGHFKTKNHLVLRVCKYVNINPDTFKRPDQDLGKIDPEAMAALARACGGQPRKTEAVIRVLRALEALAPAS